MTSLIGLPCLALAWAAGVRAARCLFQERSPLLILSAGTGLGLTALLLGTSYLLPWLPLPASLALTGALLGLGLWRMAGLPAPALDPIWPGWGAALGLSLGLGLTLRFALFEQAVGMVTESDFFIHAANLGLFTRGAFPPLNPFLGTPMHGHFGRDLLIATLAESAGIHPLTMEWLYTCALQVLTFTLLFAWLRSTTGRALTALLGASMPFFCANLGPHVGLADMVANNMATASFWLVLSSWALLRSLEVDAPASRAVAGAALGAEGAVYEVHLGLLGLTLVALTLLWPPLRARARRSLAALAVAGLVAGTVGGPFTHLAGQALGGGPTGGAAGSGQEVTLRFPKETLGQVQGLNLRPSRPFETRFRPWEPEWRPPHPEHRLWSRWILSTMWAPAWLLPLALLAMARSQSRAGLWFGTFAALSWATPGLVDFGIWEGETQRWLYGAAVGSALAFGVALGEGLAAPLRGPDRGRRAGALLALAGVTWYCTPALRLALEDQARALASPGQPLPTGRPGIVPGTGLVPRPFVALEHHYGLTPAVMEGLARLQTEPLEASFLADDGAGPLNARGALIGQARLLPTGIAPPAPDSTRNAGYEPSPAAQAFWASGDPRHLEGLPARWLILTRPHPPPFTRALERGGAFELFHRAPGLELWRARPPGPAPPP